MRTQPELHKFIVCKAVIYGGPLIRTLGVILVVSMHNIYREVPKQFYGLLLQ